ncbi:Rieske (2Fe-2S) protein [Pseudomonas massiliensis]|uniref:Rieske (2Fe-2S) protein n=1 Tax=Pseudomonas massiliensis TaxID=522492 RepID=UPI00058FEF07|nr:Rieske (2Fe-2S) protein [Pseudomonas massiliensis]
MASLTRLCALADLGEGVSRGFDPWGVGHDQVFALLHQGQVKVYRNSCPHLDVPLEYRKDRYLSADGAWIICYAHGARFDPANGRCVYGPCLDEHLSALPYRVEDAAVWLEG